MKNISNGDLFQSLLKMEVFDFRYNFLDFGTRGP